MSSRDEILADFQACTGIDDMSVAIAHLEQANWSLQIAANAAIIGNVAEVGRGGGNNAAPQEAIRRIKILAFEIKYEDRTVQISVPDDETVADLKLRIQGETQVRVEEQDLTGFRSEGGPIYHVNDNQKLSVLNLRLENSLRLRKNTPAAPPAVAAVAVGADAAASPESIDNTTATNFYPEEKEDYQLIITVLKTDGTEDQTYELNFRPAQTILKVKKDVHDITNIPVRYQKWEGWPETVYDNLQLMKSDLPRKHKLILYPSNNDESGEKDLSKAIELSKIQATQQVGGNEDRKKV